MTEKSKQVLYIICVAALGSTLALAVVNRG